MIVSWKVIKTYFNFMFSSLCPQVDQTEREKRKNYQAHFYLIYIIGNL